MVLTRRLSRATKLCWTPLKMSIKERRELVNEGAPRVTSCLRSSSYLAGAIMWVIQTLMILFPPLIDRGGQAAHVKLFWADGSFSRSSPLWLWLIPLLLPPHTLFRASVTSLQDGDKSNTKDKKRSRSELATAVHWWSRTGLMTGWCSSLAMKKRVVTSFCMFFWVGEGCGRGTNPTSVWQLKHLNQKGDRRSRGIYRYSHFTWRR